MVTTPTGAAPRVNPLLLRVEEAADVLGIGRTRVYQLINCGQLASVKIGRSRRIAVAELERFIAERTGASDE